MLNVNIIIFLRTHHGLLFRRMVVISQKMEDAVYHHTVQLILETGAMSTGSAGAPS